MIESDDIIRFQQHAMDIVINDSRAIIVDYEITENGFNIIYEAIDKVDEEKIKAIFRI